MKNEDKVLLIFPTILVLMVGFFIQQMFFPVPDFKVGDCVAYEFSAREFTPRHLSEEINHIVKVGKYNYLTMPYFLDKETGRVRPSFREFEELSIQFDDGDHVLVDCKTGKEL